MVNLEETISSIFPEKTANSAAPLLFSEGPKTTVFYVTCRNVVYVSGKFE